MADASLEWNSDFGSDATGDLLVADGDDEVRQRLERRLATARKGYVWHKEYGAGLPQKIGKALTVGEIQAVVSSQLALEASVAPSPPAQLTVSLQPDGGCIIGIKYWDAETGDPVSFQITA
jgi:phage baseplate assembly protein W